MESIKTADLWDKHGEKLSVPSTDWTSYGKRKRFSGRIETVKVFEDNVLFLKALEDVPAGSVIVVDGGGSKRCALMGDRLAGIAAERGLAGVMINGCVRDSADLADIDIGIFAVGTTPVKSKKEGKGQRDIDLAFGGIDWRPGEYVYADEDGVAVSEDKLV